VDAAPLDVADRPIEEDAALAASAGIPTVISTVAEDPDANSTASQYLTKLSLTSQFFDNNRIVSFYKSYRLSSL